ncbi:MAG: DUF2207 domain-containing protein [Gemmatimonadaceae bacterium]
MDISLFCRPARACLAAVMLCALTTSAGAQAHDIRVRDYGTLLTVHSDGTVDVVERLTIHFSGEWHGLNRDLLLRHTTAQGRQVKLDVEDGPITDSAGNPLVVEHQTQDAGWTRRYHIYIPGAVDADRTILIHYRLKNAIRFFFKSSDVGELDELYWNVTGNAWTMFIDSVHARVVLPHDVQPTQVAVYTGPEGSRASDAAIERHGNEVAFSTRHRLPPYAGLTIAVGWPAGHVEGRPTQAHEQVMQIVGWTPLLIPLLVFWFAYSAWSKHGRDPKEGSYVVRYEPIAGASAAELGTLVDNRADMADITATLVDLAVRGFIRIEEITASYMPALRSNTDYVIHLLRDPLLSKELKPYEQRYLEELAKLAPIGESSVKASDLRSEFYKALPEITDTIYDSLVEKGYYRDRPDKVRSKWGNGAFYSMVAGVLISFFVVKEMWTPTTPLAVITATFLSTITLFVFAAIMPARTEAGARAHEATLGFKEFLARVEEERYKKLITSPDQFERFLPYAMAFGVAEKWANAFKDIYRDPPTWYVGGTGQFNVSSFSHDVSTMSSVMSSSMSSSSSGSGGGGSSGGGSGGGGGSGF